MPKQGLLMTANFTEDAVALAIESYLTFVSFPFQRFSLITFSHSQERPLGADAKLRDASFRFRPIYMQFKRPSAYPDESDSRIIQDRKAMLPTPLRTDPLVLFFGLREKRDSHPDFQHNVLFRLRKRLTLRKLGDAVYVCPLFLNRSAYYSKIYRSALLGWLFFGRSFRSGELLLKDNGRTISFDKIPVLSEHVCIPPHVEVSSAKHSYSFTEDGNEVCFHSPESIREGCSLLSKWLINIATVNVSDETYLSAKTAGEALRSIVFDNDNGTTLPHEKGIFMSNDGIESWLSWGHFLRKTYGIVQLALVRWDNKQEEKAKLTESWIKTIKS